VAISFSPLVLLVEIITLFSDVVAEKFLLQ